MDDPAYGVSVADSLRKLPVVVMDPTTGPLEITAHFDKTTVVIRNIGETR
jgi:hypothetical protein